jgi:hypothetical protein
MNTIYGCWGICGAARSGMFLAPRMTFSSQTMIIEILITHPAIGILSTPDVYILSWWDCSISPAGCSIPCDFVTKHCTVSIFLRFCSLTLQSSYNLRQRSRHPIWTHLLSLSTNTPRNKSYTKRRTNRKRSSYRWHLPRHYLYSNCRTCWIPSRI